MNTGTLNTTGSGTRRQGKHKKKHRDKRKKNTTKPKRLRFQPLN